jgi:flagellar biosynthetic protein FlhB
MAGEKTEKATPKKLEDARKKGQVAKSVELNGAGVLVAAILALSAFGPKLFLAIEEATVALLHLAADPQVVSSEALAPVLGATAMHVGLATAPILMSCMIAGIAISAAQVGLRPMPGAIKPQFSKLNPLKGFKNTFLSPNSAVETVKGLVKVGVMGGVVMLALLPRIEDVSSLVGMAPGELLSVLSREVMSIAQRAAIAYIALAIADYFWQRYNHAKQLRMDQQEVRDEFKSQDGSPENKANQKRRQTETARRRMMDDVPTADVVVTNPTHFSVALRYDAAHLAPVVVAKGADHLAFKIREAARAAGVAVVPDPPLARTLYASVDVGRMIPEDLYEAVATLLAYVYRVAGRQAAAAGARA